jgi:hypothetical protein
MTDLDALFSSMRAHLERHGAAPELRLASPGGENLSVVAALPERVARRLAAVAREIAAPPHRPYPADGMHLTVLNLDPWRRVGGDADALATAALDAAARCAPVEGEARGLNLAPGIVFAQVLADGLGALRRAMVAALDALAPGRFLPWGPALAGVESGHVTIVRFAAAGPVGDELLDAVAARRAEPYGRLRIDELELVHLRGKTLAEGATVRRCAIGVGP